MRPENVAGSAITFAIGYFLLQNTPLKVGFLVGLYVLMALHAFATVQNDIADFDIDKANKRKSALLDQSISKDKVQLIVKLLA